MGNALHYKYPVGITHHSSRLKVLLFYLNRTKNWSKLISSTELNHCITRRNLNLLALIEKCGDVFKINKNTSYLLIFKVEINWISDDLYKDIYFFLI